MNFRTATACVDFGFDMAKQSDDGKEVFTKFLSNLIVFSKCFFFSFHGDVLLVRQRLYH